MTFQINPALNGYNEARGRQFFQDLLDRVRAIPGVKSAGIGAVPVLHELSHLPVILDPSHATGKRSLVPAVARAGVAIGAEGLIIEVHPCPEKAVSDGAQSLTLDGFRQMMKELTPYIRLWSEARAGVAAVA